MNNSDECAFILRLAAKACEMARAAYSPVGVAFSLKEDSSPVTEHDILINDMIIDEVQKHYPDWGVLGEERQWQTEQETLLVVDPIDGTRAFTYGIPIFGFFAALVRDGEPFIGVIANPIVSRTLYAEKGQGAYHLETGNPVNVRSAAQVAGEVCNVNSSSTVSAHLRKNIRLSNSRAMGLYSATESASLVAMGHIVADFLTLNTPHDVAATKVVVEEAGGKVTNLHGGEQRYDQQIDGAIISNGNIHDELVALYEQSVVADESDPSYQS